MGLFCELLNSCSRLWRSNLLLFLLLNNNILIASFYYLAKFIVHKSLVMLKCKGGCSNNYQFVAIGPLQIVIISRIPLTLQLYVFGKCVLHVFNIPLSCSTHNHIW